MEVPFNSRRGLALEMRDLEQDLLEMGSRAESMVSQAVGSLARLDTGQAFDVIHRDDDIDERDLDIENRCLKLLALQQPMASDLRVIGTVMKLIVDIERVGDLAVDIAKITLKVDKELGETELYRSSENGKRRENDVSRCPRSLRPKRFGSCRTSCGYRRFGRQPLPRSSRPDPRKNAPTSGRCCERELAATSHPSFGTYCRSCLQHRRAR